MRRLVILLGLFVLFIHPLSAQTLYFCEGVDANGLPINYSTLFKIDKGGGYFYFLVRLPSAVNCESMEFRIFRKDNYANTTFDTSIFTETERGWTWFWKKVTFYDTGKFHIEVIDCSGHYVTSAVVTIEYR